MTGRTPVSARRTAKGAAKPPNLVAILLPDLGGGGAERIAVNLAGGIAARGHAVDLVVLHAEGPLLTRLPAGVSLVGLGTGRASLSLFALTRYLRHKRPDLLVAHLHAANMLAVVARMLAASPTRLAVTVHNNVRHDLANESHLLKPAFPFFMRLSYPRADAIVAVSQGVADSIRATGIRSKRVRTVYNPVVSAQLFESAREPIAHPWVEQGQPPLILTVGRLERQKDHATLLTAFARLRRQREAHLLVLGEGSNRSLLEAQARKLGVSNDVSFPGFVTNPYPFMKLADVFVLSSAWEGLPTVLIEALALGANIVSTDCRDGPREILGGGRYGRLVPVGDVEALALAMEEAVSQGAVVQPSSASWQSFTVDTAVEAYLSVGRSAEA